MKQWYEELFENYGVQYDRECFVHGTTGECDFFENEMDFNKSLRIIDIACGTGRHTLELTRRGYRVTGIDLSESLLQRAREKATEQNLTVDFRQMDARSLAFEEEFDLAIMICEGAFPLMETDEMNYAILQGAFRALKTGGKFIFTTLNGLFPLFHSIKEFLDKSGEPGNAVCDTTSFDLMTFREHSVTRFEDDNGNSRELKCDERYYVPSEIMWLMKSAGFGKVDIFGARLGAFSRNDKLTTEDFEMLVVASK